MKGMRRTALLTALLFSAGAEAQERQFDLSPMDAVHGIPEFARQAGIQIVAPADDLGGALTPAIHGNLDVRVALKKLLGGTSLEIVSDDGTVITLGRRIKTAQPSDDPSHSRAAESSAMTASIQEVIVTATKRAEPLQTLPQTVSAVTGQTLQDMGATSFTDYARTIPGLSYVDSGNGRQKPALRGVNPSSGVLTIGYYIGETPVAAANYNSTVINPDLVDLERVEILRGPQGTLYGSGSIGGTIRLIPNAPNLSKIEGEIQGAALTTHTAHGEAPGGTGDAVFNLPLVENVAAARLAVWVRDVDGFIDRRYGYTNDFGPAPHPTGTVKNIPNENTWGLRGTVLVEPVEDFKLTAMVLLQKQKFNGFQDITGGTANPDNRLRQDFISDTPEPQRNNFSIYSLTADYALNPVDLVSTTSYSSSNTYLQDESTSVLPGLSPLFPIGMAVNVGNYQFTNETRLATTERIWGFDAVIGFYYAKNHNTTVFDLSPPEFNQIANGNDPTSPIFAPGNNLFGSSQHGSERQTAEFGELTYHFTDSLSLIAGLRNFSVANRNDGFNDGLFGNGPNGLPSPIKPRGESSGVVHKGNLSYKITPDYLVYAQYSEGFRPGHGNTPPPSTCAGAPTELPQVQPDTIKNYELGAKTSWLDKRLTVNMALYRIDWSNIQQAVSLKCGFAYAANLGDAVIKGVELEVSDRLTSRTSLGMSGSYTQAELQQNIKSSGAFAGDQITDVPVWQYAVYGMNTFPILQNDDGYVRVDYQYTGSSWGSYNRIADGVTRDPLSHLEVNRLLNLKAGMKYGAWDFSLAGNNLFNWIATQSVDVNALTFAIPNRPRYVINRPRTFMLNALYKF